MTYTYYKHLLKVLNLTPATTTYRHAALATIPADGFTWSVPKLQCDLLLAGRPAGSFGSDHVNPSAGVIAGTARGCVAVA